MPVGAYGGRKDIMECVAPVGEVYQAGTLSGNPIAMTAGLVTLQTLMENKNIYNQIEEKTKKLADAYRNAFGEKVCVNQIGSLMSVFFTDQEVVDYDTAKTSDTDMYAKYFCYMLDNGINFAPSQFESMFMSAAHTDEDIEETCKMIKRFAVE